jgi:alpha/beta superfamily hydrolase
MLPGPAGRLEALLNLGDPDATHAALICHPHPLFGGTMHNKVVYHAMKALAGFGFHCLRFNFRGAGLSEGVHDEGRGEQEDVRAALTFLENEFQLPVIFCGFSFGAATGLRVGCRDERVVGCISLGTPVNVQGRHYTYGYLKECVKAKLFVSGAHDEFAPQEQLREAFDHAGEPKQLVVVEGAGHFFDGRLNEMQRAIEVWVRELYKPPEGATEQT